MNKSLNKKLDQLLANTGDMALKRRARMIMNQLDPQPGEKIVDIGCGDGYYLHLLDSLKVDLKLTGTDYDQAGLDHAKNNLDPKIKLFQADLMKRLPFKDQTFQKAVMSEVAEHLPNDVKGLKEVYRILKPGGVLCLTVPNAKYPFLWDPVNWLLEHTTGEHIKAGFWAGLWNQHIRLYRKAEIKKAVEQAGFKVEMAEAVTFWSLPFNHYLVNLVARYIARNRQNQQLVAAVNKFSKQVKRPGMLNLLFAGVNKLDQLNDRYQHPEIGVGVFIKAVK